MMRMHYDNSVSADIATSHSTIGRAVSNATIARWDESHILQLMGAQSAKWNAFSAAPSFAKLLAAREACKALDEAKVAVRDAFAAPRGWRITCPFTISQLRVGSNVPRSNDYDWRPWPMDHPEYFRLVRRPWKPIAIISHEYSSFADSLALAAKYELNAELLPVSWYVPRHCNAVLYTAPPSSRR